MKKRVSLQELRLIIRRLVESELDDDLDTVKPGDVVDVDMEYAGVVPVRVLKIVDDVNKVAGPPDERDPHTFSGPGFVGEIDPKSGESGTLVFSLHQVVPGSKMKGYFPTLGDQVYSNTYAGGRESEYDEYGRPMQNPYRRMAQRYVAKSQARHGDYAAGLPDDLSDISDDRDIDELDESEEEHEGDPRWEKHADPTGKEWSVGLDEADDDGPFHLDI